MKKPIIIDLHDCKFGIILTCAIRYSLGRRTSIPRLVTDYIRPLLPELDENTLLNMERDINKHGGEDGIVGYKNAEAYGDICDYHTWYFFLNDIRAEINGRKQENQVTSNRKM